MLQPAKTRRGFTCASVWCEARDLGAARRILKKAGERATLSPAGRECNQETAINPCHLKCSKPYWSIVCVANFYMCSYVETRHLVRRPVFRLGGFFIEMGPGPYFREKVTTLQSERLEEIT